MVTIYKNLFDKKAFHISVDAALERIKSGKSKDKVEVIRNMIDKDRSSKLKANLPSICFSGKFEERKDESLIEHSGYIVLDFDAVINLREKQEEIIQYPYIYACWISPSGNGLKALVKVADGNMHRQHFQALQDIFPDVDRSGINVSRVCFESYDPNLYINTAADSFTSLKSIDKISISNNSDNDIFNNILKWLANRGDSFKTGERNRFIFLLSSACCRYGMSIDSTTYEIYNRFPFSNDFTRNECEQTIKSAYRANQLGSAQFTNDKLIDKITYSEVVIDAAIYDESIKPSDVIFGEDVKGNAIEIWDKGYEALKGIGISEIDDRWKLKRGELNCLTGIGNYGKSTFMKWYLIMRALLHDEKFALFAPEDNPAHEFYHECSEILLGASCLPSNHNRPSLEHFNAAYDFISNHFFFIHPKHKSPTPAYVKERFLELIVKNEVDGCIIDPFNQMSNDYANYGGRSDKYLEFILSDITQFSRENNVYLLIVAHPHKMIKDSTGNYPCPDVFDLADGAMWSNKCDNILAFHRTNFQKNPEGSDCEFHSKKIRRQRSVGIRGISNFQYNRSTRRFIFDDNDPMQRVTDEHGFIFAKKYKDYLPKKSIPIPIEKPKMWYDKDGYEPLDIENF